MTGLVLHNYFRSSTSIRLRAALNLKGLPYDYVAYHLQSGEQRSDAYLGLNPQGLVPALALADGTVLTQSLAIIEYLDEIHRDPPLLPADPVARARVRSLAFAIACDIHPLNNLRVLNYLRSEFDADQDEVTAWFRHWACETMAPLETMLARSPLPGPYASGETPGLADLCLYAQVLNNRRFGVDAQPYPEIARIFAALEKIPAFADAAPDRQPDAE